MIKITQKLDYPWPALFEAIIDSILNPGQRVIFLTGVQTVIMEDREDQMDHRTGMQQRHKGREGRQGLGSNRQTVVICVDKLYLYLQMSCLQLNRNNTDISIQK